mmetsp:Transcript_19043/g.39762  ORF Transcript_19043/g.39762 Transcript_19043/m.39762 type:complete len:175 (-) Transcript_19043:31-555(-)
MNMFMHLSLHGEGPLAERGVMCRVCCESTSDDVEVDELSIELGEYIGGDDYTEYQVGKAGPEEEATFEIKELTKLEPLGDSSSIVGIGGVPTFERITKIVMYDKDGYVTTDPAKEDAANTEHESETSAMTVEDLRSVKRPCGGRADIEVVEVVATFRLRKNNECIVTPLPRAAI